MKAALLLVLMLGCTKPNPAVCCVTEEDCTSIGVTGELRECDPGLACVDHACVVPSCSTDGCGAGAPVCDITTDVCVGCTDSSECTRFADTDVCDPASGACVECVTNAECAADAPVCDAGICRVCRVDSECQSGACGDDGTCVDEVNVVYLDPEGTDTGTCSRSVPCSTINFALSQTSPSRAHIVMAMGSYAGQIFTVISPTTTTALSIGIHGGGSTLTNTGGDGQILFGIEIPTTIRDLTINYSPFGIGISSLTSTTLERVTIRSETGIRVRGPVEARDVVIESTGSTSAGIRVESGSLTYDRGQISGGSNAVVALSGTVNLSNLTIYGTSKTAVDLTPSSAAVGGSISFVTISDTGVASTTTAGISCFSNSFPVRSSIIWTPGSNRPATDTCSFTSTIAGPIGVIGAMNTDPKFVAGGDYHLMANSPAVDVVDQGPTLDFEGDPRPQGARFDLGADERR
jgi:hypothetical protein